MNSRSVSRVSAGDTCSTGNKHLTGGSRAAMFVPEFETNAEGKKRKKIDGSPIIRGQVATVYEQRRAPAQLRRVDGARGGCGG